MKIAIDLRAMDGASRYRGIGIYIVFLLNSLLPKLTRKHKVTLYVYDRKNLKGIDNELLSSCTIIKATPSHIQSAPTAIKKLFRGVLPREYRRSHALPGIEDCDVFFQPYHEMGIPEAVKERSIVTAYDLIPLIFEGAYYRKNKPTFNSKVFLKFLRESALRHVYKQGLEQFNRAEHIISISDNTKDDLTKYLGINPSKITTIYLGTPDTFRGNVSRKFKDTLNKEPYLAYVGGIDSRRPIDKLLLRSGDIYRNFGVRTIVAGHDFENISDPTLSLIVDGAVKSGAIVVFGHISEAEKDVLIRGAVAFVYPTLYEGFGIPLLESFIRKTPVITYKNSSIPEVAGDAALFVESVDDIPKLVAKLSKDKDFYDRYVGRGIQQAKQFSWETCAKETMQIIESMK